MTPPRGVTAKVVAYELRGALRSRWLLGYTAFFLVATDALLRFGGDGAKALLSLVNVVLLIIPLVTVVFGTMYIYDAREFTELLLAQPVSRRQLFSGLYLGLTLPLSAGFAVGVGAPFLLHGGVARGTLLTLVGTGVALTCTFTAVSFLIAVRSEDRVRGLGAAIALWLGFAVLYDGLVLLLASLFADWPLERGLLGLMLANPVDLARVALLLRLDVSALMGYTGAVFRHFFGSVGGAVLAAAALSGWIAAPLFLAMRAFERKDF
jgi:Cu-processing system permease protein